MINFKSILFKGKYYPISFKLNYILRSCLFKVSKSKYPIYNEEFVKSQYDKMICYDKFILSNFKLTTRVSNCIIKYYLSHERKLHRINKPARVCYQNKIKRTEAYYEDGKYHRLDGPSLIEYDRRGRRRFEIYHLNDKKHRINGPAYIMYFENKIIQEDYFINNKLHRMNNPASISYYKNGNVSSISYYTNNMRCRLNGPAVIEYYPDGNVLCQAYYINDKLHRYNGPAYVEYDIDGTIIKEECYINGVKL